MALGASSASAADAPSDPGVLGSLTATVDPAGATAAMSPITDPLQHVTARIAPASDSSSLLQTVPVLPDVVARVPDIARTPAGTALEPVTSLVDGVVAEVPVVRAVVPAGTVTEVTAPVVGAVDGIAGSVTAPVFEVAAPVVRVIDPVVDVVVPLPELSSPTPGAPVPSGPVPVMPIPVPVPAPPTAPADEIPAEVDQAQVDAEPAMHRTATPDDTAADAPGTPAAVTEAAMSGTRGTAFVDLASLAGPAAAAVLPFPNSQADLPVTVAVPTIAQLAPGVQDVPALPGSSSLSTGVTASMTGGGMGAPLAALSGSAFLIVPVLNRIGRRSASFCLPVGPSFEPGSSPD
ncbi:hypothetical protein [Arthrobacter pityocampae]|uniref:hypothetical protein n=1 Tax=Arthrobacter pityocampae TaxID=547334 RepID=UPI003735718E